MNIIKDETMLNKHEGNLLLVSALVCIPMLLLQGVLLAPPPPHRSPCCWS